MKRRLKSFPLYKPKERDSEYVGTERIWQLVGEARADVQPADGALVCAEYGERAKNMWILYMDSGADIQSGYGAFSICENGEPEYSIISVKRYPTHTVAIAERPVTADG